MRLVETTQKSEKKTMYKYPRKDSQSRWLGSIYGANYLRLAIGRRSSGTCIGNFGFGICGTAKRDNEKPNLRRDNVTKGKYITGNYKSG